MTRHRDQSDDKRNASPGAHAAATPESEGAADRLRGQGLVASQRFLPTRNSPTCWQCSRSQAWTHRPLGLYNVGEWAASPARLVIGDRSVRLDGYRNQPPHSIEILGLDRSRITFSSCRQALLITTLTPR